MSYIFSTISEYQYEKALISGIILKTVQWQASCSSTQKQVIDCSHKGLLILHLSTISPDLEHWFYNSDILSFY